MKPLTGKVAVVAGATRGCGRAIAVMLGEAGATVYVTGRSTRGNPSDLERQETIEETAELVRSRGGTGIPVRVDHTVPEEVKRFFEQVKQEQNGQLDILVNDVWGGEHLMEWDKPIWEQSLEKGMLLQQRAVHSHLYTNHYGLPLMVNNRSGLVVEMTDGVGYYNRGVSLFYSLAKSSICHMAAVLADELKPYEITAVSVTPGFLRSEQMLDHFGVQEENWRDATAKEPHFIASETPYFVGQGIAELAADRNAFDLTGQFLSSWVLADRYGFTDADGRKPHWGKYAMEHGFYRHLPEHEQRYICFGPGAEKR